MAVKNLPGGRRLIVKTASKARGRRKRRAVIVIFQGKRRRAKR